MGPLNIPGIPPNFRKYFISFVDTITWYAYVSALGQRSQAASTIQQFFDSIEKALGEPPRWLISDNASEYTSAVVTQTLGDMNVLHIPAIPHNSEEDGIAKRFNKTAMNAVHAALIYAKMSWSY